MNEIAEAVETPVEEAPQEPSQEVTPETPPETPETPPAEPPAKVTFDEAQQTVFNNAILAKDRKHFEKFNAQNEQLQKLQSENQQLQAKIPVAARPEVPEMPDKYDENFSQKLQARETALIAQGDFDRNERIASQTNLANQQQQQRNQHEAIQTAKTGYDSRADNLGLKAKDIDPAWNTLINHGVNVHIQAHLLDEATGPQIVDYLAKNPLEMDKLAGMNPMSGAIFIATELRDAAAGAAKKINLAPAPVDTLKGNGAREGSRGPKGATFE